MNFRVLPDLVGEVPFTFQERNQFLLFVSAIQEILNKSTSILEVFEFRMFVPLHKYSPLTNLERMYPEEMRILKTGMVQMASKDGAVQFVYLLPNLEFALELFGWSPKRNIFDDLEFYGWKPGMDRTALNSMWDAPHWTTPAQTQGYQGTVMNQNPIWKIPVLFNAVSSEFCHYTSAGECYFNKFTLKCRCGYTIAVKFPKIIQASTKPVRVIVKDFEHRAGDVPMHEYARNMFKGKITSFLDPEAANKPIKVERIPGLMGINETSKMLELFMTHEFEWWKIEPEEIQ